MILITNAAIITQDRNNVMYHFLRIMQIVAQKKLEIIPPEQNKMPPSQTSEIFFAWGTLWYKMVKIRIGQHNALIRIMADVILWCSKICLSGEAICCAISRKHDTIQLKNMLLSILYFSIPNPDIRPAAQPSRNKLRDIASGRGCHLTVTWTLRWCFAVFTATSVSAAGPRPAKPPVADFFFFYCFRASFNALAVVNRIAFQLRLRAASMSSSRSST